MPELMRTTCAAMLLAVLAVSVPAAQAQTGGDYDLTWYTVDSGGGTVSGGDYTLEGSIGQPDAFQPLIGGDYDLTGGFMPGKAPEPGSAVSTWALY